MKGKWELRLAALVMLKLPELRQLRRVAVGWHQSRDKHRHYVRDIRWVAYARSDA